VGLLQVVVTAMVQAITAFFPIGSSGHLALVQHLTGWPSLDGSAAVAAYIGMLLAVAGYLWRDVLALAIGIGQLCRGKIEAESRLLLYLAVAAAPLAIAAIALRGANLIPVLSPTAIGWTTLAFGLALYVSDRIGVTVRRIGHMTWNSALIIGFAQVLALAPGVGRVGSAVTFARFLGFERAEAARFSLLLSLPTLIGAIAFSGADLVGARGLHWSPDMLLAGVSAFIAGLAAIAFMISWVNNASFAPFASYRIAAGAALLSWIYFA